jgi:membrane-associated phospholipid phosphatase
MAEHEPRLLSPRGLKRLVWLGLALLLTATLLKLVLGVPEPGFLSVNQWAQSAPNFWANLTQLGDTAVVFALLTPVLCRHPRVYFAWLSAVPIGGAMSLILKRSLDWPRPADVLPLDQLHVVGWVLNGRSFPSGHTITAVALAVMVGLYWQSLSSATRVKPLWVWAALGLLAWGAAVSRMAVGAHWPTDLLAGTGVGLMAAAFAAWVLARWSWQPGPWAQACASLALLTTSWALMDRAWSEQEPGALVLTVAAVTVWVSLVHWAWQWGRGQLRQT